MLATLLISGMLAGAPVPKHWTPPKTPLVIESAWIPRVGAVWKVTRDEGELWYFSAEVYGEASIKDFIDREDQTKRSKR